MESKKGLTISEKIKIYSEVDRDLGLEFDLSAIRKKHSTAADRSNIPDCLVCGTCLSHFDTIVRFTEHKQKPCEPHYICYCHAWKPVFPRLHCKMCSATLMSPWHLLMHVYTAHHQQVCAELPTYLPFTPPSSPQPVRKTENVSIEEKSCHVSEIAPPRAVSFSNRDDVVLISPIHFPSDESESELSPYANQTEDTGCLHSSSQLKTYKEDKQLLSKSAQYIYVDGPMQCTSQLSTYNPSLYVQASVNMGCVATQSLNAQQDQLPESGLDDSPGIKLYYDDNMN